MAYKLETIRKEGKWWLCEDDGDYYLANSIITNVTQKHGWQRYGLSKEFDLEKAMELLKMSKEDFIKIADEMVVGVEPTYKIGDCMVKTGNKPTAENRDNIGWLSWAGGSEYLYYVFGYCRKIEDIELALDDEATDELIDEALDVLCTDVKNYHLTEVVGLLKKLNISDLLKFVEK